MTTIEIGQTNSGKVVSLPLARANRHGLVTGSTGGGKTVTLQRLAEEFSRAGVPEANSCRPTDESHEAGQERSGYEYSPVKLHVWS